jgi:hypothetical protein
MTVGEPYRYYYPCEKRMCISILCVNVSKPATHLPSAVFIFYFFLFVFATIGADRRGGGGK